MKCFGKESKQNLNKLRRKLLISSLTSFVKNMSEDKVVEVLVQLKLPSKSRERARCRGALVKYYLDNKDQQAQIRDMLLASKELVSDSNDGDHDVV